MQNEVAVSHTIDTHMHNLLVTHTDRRDTAITISLAVTMLLFALPCIAFLHAAVLLVVIRLASWTVNALGHTNQALLRALHLCLLIRLHSLVNLAFIGKFRSGQTDDCDLFLPLCFVGLDLLALATLELRILNDLFLLFTLLLASPLDLNGFSYLGFIA